MHVSLEQDRNPLVTVFILTYQKFDNIYKNLESVLSQSYSNIEIVISDDGSDSFPKNEISLFIEERKTSNINNVVIIENKENRGTVKNINTALRNSKGILYIPLSQDDIFFSNTVIEEIIDRFLNKPFNILITSRYGINKFGEFQRFWPHVKVRPLVEKMNVSEMFCFLSEGFYLDFASGSVMTINADFYKKIGPFDERYHLWEDAPFLHKCLRLGYKIDTAYDIISIKYEQTQGLSNSSGVNELMKKDFELYRHTDQQIGNDKYGFQHKRTMSFFNRIWKSSNFLERCIINIFYIDVKIRLIISYSNLFHNWSKLDREVANKIEVLKKVK